MQRSVFLVFLAKCGGPDEIRAPKSCIVRIRCLYCIVNPNPCLMNDPAHMPFVTLLLPFGSGETGRVQNPPPGDPGLM